MCRSSANRAKLALPSSSIREFLSLELPVLDINDHGSVFHDASIDDMRKKISVLIRIVVGESSCYNQVK